MNRVYIVLPEAFGVNAWVRSVADRLAAQGHPALAVHLFARTAPNLDLACEASDVLRGRRNTDAITTDQILGDVAFGVGLVTRPSPGSCHPRGGLLLWGACRLFGGHVARG